jgi:hypothetical protein
MMKIQKQDFLSFETNEMILRLAAEEVFSRVQHHVIWGDKRHFSVIES